LKADNDVSEMEDGEDELLMFFGEGGVLFGLAPSGGGGVKEGFGDMLFGEGVVGF
jgi:hypothetical protein